MVVITSNNEKELPDAFLRRCVFHFIEFPDQELMRRIVRVHHPELDERAASSRRSRRSTSCATLHAPAQAALDERAHRLDRRAQGAPGVDSVELDEELPFLGVLLKREQDLLAFAERQARGRGRG